MQEWVRVTADNAHQLRIGDRLLETELGNSIYSIVISLPVSDGPVWTWTAAGVFGGTIDYLITAGFEHYGPYVYVARGDEDDSTDIETSTDKPKETADEATV